MSYRDEFLRKLLHNEENEEVFDGVKKLLSEKGGDFLVNYMQFVLMSMN